MVMYLFRLVLPTVQFYFSLFLEVQIKFNNTENRIIMKENIIKFLMILIFFFCVLKFY